MSDPKKIVIKINRTSAQKKRLPNRSAPDQITEWNIRRILGALIVLLLFIVIPYYYLDNGFDDVLEVNSTNVEQEFEKETITSGKEPQSGKSVVTKSHQNEVVQKTDDKSAVGTPADNVKQSTKPSTKPLIATREKREEYAVEQTIVHHKVIRALLARGIANKEPFGEIKTFVKVRRDKATGIFYFNELKGMKGWTLYHQWVHDGRLVYKRPIKVGGNHWRVSTSKLFSFSRQGDWTVRLIDQEGKIYNEIHFKVIAE